MIGVGGGNLEVGVENVFLSFKIYLLVDNISSWLLMHNKTNFQPGTSCSIVHLQFFNISNKSLVD